MATAYDPDQTPDQTADKANDLERVSGAADAFRDVPKTGVIFVMSEAGARGWRGDDPSWTNFGQGMPEAGPMPGAPDRVDRFDVDVDDHEYAPVAGIPELREAVADHYNRLYRQDKSSKYTAENVCISSGGRASLTRIAASLGRINLGHFLPDYTAYEELLDLFRNFSPIPILLDPERGYDFSPKELEREVLGRGLSAILMSNPCNPTGRVIAGETLRSWVDIAKRHDCTLILDEFYSHYVWDGEPDEGFRTATAAAYVEDVDVDPVVIVNGLTKNWRYPGWRVAWTIGPRDVIEKLSSAGSFLDGGGNRPMQRAAVPLLSDEHTLAEVAAIQRTFRDKRAMMLDRLTSMGIRVESPPTATFYVWGNVSGLPEGIDDGMSFFQAALEERCICVPGEFFDVNPGQRRGRSSRFKNHVRFSFGPNKASLEAGLDRLEAMIARHR